MISHKSSIDAMTTDTRTLEEIRTLGLAALARELGTVGMVRFIQQFGNGRGDYTRERHERLDQLSIDDITRMIAEQRASSDKR